MHKKTNIFFLQIKNFLVFNWNIHVSIDCIWLKNSTINKCEINLTFHILIE